MNRTRSGAWYIGPLLLVCMSFAACMAVGQETLPDPPLPLSQAPQRQSGEQETQNIVGAVQKSGDVPPEIQPILFRAAEAAFVETFDNTGGAQIQRGGCFAGGCLFFVTFANRCGEQDFRQQFSDKAHTRLHGWPGPVYRSPPLKTADKQIHVTWALLLYDKPDRRARLEALLQPPRLPLAGITDDVCRSANPAPATNPAPQGVK